MTGTIAGQEIVHDLDADWVLGGHYLYFHEIARDRDERGGKSSNFARVVLNRLATQTD